MEGYNVLNKVVLFIAQDYIERTVADDHKVPSILIRLKGAVAGYKLFHMFSYDEAQTVIKMAKSEDIDNIMSKEVSFTIFTMELMKLWILNVPREHRPHLNISDKHFKIGGKMFWKQMIALKTEDSESYNLKTSIIDDSCSVAKEFFDYHYNIFIKGEADATN